MNLPLTNDIMLHCKGKPYWSVGYRDSMELEHTQKYILLLLDSPGLVDGDMSYPFDVNEAILWLSELCDLVFVFFDPIGQVCKQ